MRILAYLIFISVVLSGAAQQTLSKRTKVSTLEKAMDLYKSGKYSASLVELTRYREMGGVDPQADYYLAVNNLKLERSVGELQLIRFVRKHHNHYLSTNAFFDLGNYYFKKKDYLNCVKYGNRVKLEDLNQEMKDQWYFQKGYSHLQLNESGQSILLFEASVALKGTYFYPSSYYLTYIYNSQSDFERVLEYTKPQISQKSDFQMQFLVLHLNALYQFSEWQEIITIGEPQLSTARSDFNIKASRLIGEAYFRLNKYRLAANTLEDHLKLSGGKIEAEAYFMLGKSYLELNKDDLAIKYFKVSGLKNSDYGQLSSYYLGLLYQRANDKNKAISALSLSSNLSTQPAIRAQSLFLAGKLSYEIKDYNRSIDYLKSYLALDSLDEKDKREGQELISNAYLLTPDYDLAIEHMESMGKLSEQIQKSYQKVTYQKANSLFNDRQFVKAKMLVDKSLKYLVDDELAAKSYYLKGEIHFILGELEAAKKQYLKQIHEYPFSESTNNSLYALGYLAYNKYEYSDAETYFFQYVREADSTQEFFVDAQMRLADSYFVQKKWNEALNEYKALQKSISFKQTYLFYRMGQIAAYQKDFEAARMNFRNVLNQSEVAYKEEALLAMADSYLEQGNFEQALTRLNEFIKNYKNSFLIPEAFNKRAIAYFNLNQYASSLKDYKEVLSRSIRSDAAEDAIFGIQNLIKSGYVVEDYNVILSNFKVNNPNNTNLEGIDFEGAKASYFNQEFRVSIRRFAEFLQEFPTSSLKDEAQYYLADSHYKLENYDEAANAFSSVINHSNIYQSRSYDKRGKALMAINKEMQAIENYRSFLMDAKSEKDAYIANEGLMNAYIKIQQADSTISFADKLLNSRWQTPGGVELAYLAQGKAYMQSGNVQKAISKFEDAYKDNNGATGAEAMYLKSVVLADQQKFEKSNEQLFTLNTTYPGFKEWIDKAYLLIVQNYISLENLFQAKATVESILKGSTTKKTLEEAKKLMKEIQLLEATIITNQDTLTTDSIR